jgi:cytochrome c553
MSKISNSMMACLGAVAILTFSGASFAGDAVTVNEKNGEKIFKEGKDESAKDKGDAVTACYTCHGDKALGNDAMGTPRLANLGYVYVVKQLTNFSKDERVPVGLGAAMNGFAKALTEQERRDVAAYINSLPKENEPSDLAALKADGTKVGVPYLGLKIVRYGTGEKETMSACISCHGFNGRGADPVYPKIGQQKYVYLVSQLKSWRNAALKVSPLPDGEGSRANDPMGQMRKIAAHLTDNDIANAAAFLSQAADSTPGDGMEVANQTVLENIKKHH